MRCNEIDNLDLETIRFCLGLSTFVRFVGFDGFDEFVCLISNIFPRILEAWGSGTWKLYFCIFRRITFIYVYSSYNGVL